MRAPATAAAPAAPLPDLSATGADPAAPLVAEGRWHLAVVGGLEAGAQIDLPAVQAVLTVGRGPDNLVALDHPTVSRRHLSLTATPTDVRLTDLGARNGTRVAGRRVGASTSIGLDDVIRVGAVALEVRRGPAPLPRRTSPMPRGAPARLFNRPPRSVPPPDPPLLDPHPFDARAHDPTHVHRGAGVSITMLLGPVAFGAVLAVLFSPLMAVFALMGPALMVGSWAERRWHDRRDRRRSAGLRHLSTTAFAGQARHRHHVELAARRLAQPDPTLLRRWADGASRLWERRPHDHDAFRLSVGLTDHPWVPWPDAEDPLDSSTAAVLGALGPLVDTPVVVALGPGRAIGVVGPAAPRDALMRWLICQVATIHGPADVTIRLLTPHDAHPAWAFVERLPHAREQHSDRDGIVAADHPLDLVVIPDASSDDLIEPLARLLSNEHPARSALVAVEALDQLPSWCTTVVELVEGDGRAMVHTPGSGAIVDSVLATGLTTSRADSWTNALARHRDPEVTSASDGLPDRIATEQLVGPSTPAAIVERWDRSRRRPGDVPAPLGVTVAPSAPGPQPFTIDLIADGPHALIGGTTGAGKSELLRTMVLSLALHHPPDAVSFLLVDYKGGSAFDACTDLPHTVGLVTDLDPHLASRALVALDAEIRRREQVLRHAGVADLATGAVPSLARLVVVIDEFATLAAELPGFLDALVDVAQRGRSLGVHLVLATQRPHGAINDRIRTNTNLRIALRMLDRAESSDVIDDPAAARLPRDRPGRGYARFGHDELVPFQAALTEPARLRALVDQICEAAAMADVGRPTTPWLPPLPRSLTLEALDAVEPADAGSGPDDTSRLSVPLALADEPARQRQRAWSWHPERGNLLVYGMPGSGTTTTLVSVGLTIARRPDRHRFHLYGVADGSGRLRVLHDLAEVGAIIDGDDVRRQARLVRMLTEELDRRRAAVDADRPVVVVLVDDLPGLLRRFDTIEGHPVVDAVHRVFRDGPVVGLHLVVSGDRPGAIPAVLASRTTERLVLHLADPFDRASLGLRPPGGPGLAGDDWTPGRGVVGQGAGTEVQVARCHDPASEVRLLAGRPRPEGDLAVERPSAIGELPTRVAVADLPHPRARLATGGRQTLDLPIGIGDHDLQARGFELATGDHALIVGPARSGRSTALAVLARSVLARSVLARSAIEPAGCVIALTPRPSPLRTCPGVTVVADMDRVLAAVARSGEAETILVLVDDCELVDDPGGAIGALLETSRPGLHLVAAGRADRLRTAYGHWSSALRACGRGLTLRPDLDRDGDLWGIRLPRDTASRQYAGRGFLVLDGTTELVQVATPEPPTVMPDGPTPVTSIGPVKAIGSTTTILGYVLEQPVRVGRATTVHRARCPPGDEQFALKVASSGLATDEIARVQLCLGREAGVLSRVHHPGLVPLVEVLEIPAARGRLRRYGTTPVPATDVGIVLAWARLGSLADAIAVGSIGPTPAVAMAHQLAGALAALHAAGFVHGDVSPGNVLRADACRWWLSDLGEAAPVGAAQPLPRRGTDGFMAPEVLDGAPIDEAADVFALGSVIAAAIGIPSIGIPSIGVPSNDDDEIMSAVHDLVGRATSPDAADRPSAAELERAFERLTTPPDRPPPPHARDTRPPSATGVETRDFPMPLVAGPSDEPGPAHRPRPSMRRAATVAVSATLVVAAALVGLLVLRSGSSARTEALPHPDQPPPTVAQAVLDPQPCPGPAAETPAGAVVVPGDPDGVGCTIAVLWWPDRAEAERPDASGARHRFSMGRPGDQLLLGDWDGDGRDTPALYDPSAGTVSRFDGWARSGEALSGAVVTTDAPLGGLARVTRSPDTDQIEVDP